MVAMRFTAIGIGRRWTGIALREDDGQGGEDGELEGELHFVCEM